MKHPLATELCDLVDNMPPELRMILAHVVCCGPCRRGVINIIQSGKGYPDLFANPASEAADIINATGA